PLWLHLGFKEGGHGRAVLAAILSLAGGFALRYGIVRVAPALLHQFPHVTGRDVETPLYQTWIGAALLALTVILAVVIPVLLTRTGALWAPQPPFAVCVPSLATPGAG